VTGDGRVTGADVAAIVRRWGAEAGDEDYDPRYDLDKNGRIGLRYLQIAISQLGRHCHQNAD
jgi:hypothetical protein